MEELIFCPKCRAEALQWDGENKLSCAECSFTLYHNCAAAVAVIIRYKDKILLTKRSQDPGKGLLDLAGGFVDPAERAEETCYRELVEEMGWKIDITKLTILGTQPNVYRFNNIDYNTLDIFFEYQVEDVFQVSLQESEILEILWVPLKELNLYEIAFVSQRRFLKQYIAEKLV